MAGDRSGLRIMLRDVGCRCPVVADESDGDLALIHDRDTIERRNRVRQVIRTPMEILDCASVSLP